ncbi:MAG TPA: G1 family glutamic endopeptidase [Solirubrobacteraceae bacterium]|nr:G1 family glutamic endopeptidase [Solirubrobacteraceae bacterium]
MHHLVARSRGVVVTRRVAACLSVMLVASALTAAGASALSAHGQLLRLAPGKGGAPRSNANQSSNWFGYNQGTVEQGGKLFNSITGNWTVPKATQHAKGQAEYSSDWVGIGGGCIDSGCVLTDSSLIQTGTEQDVGTNGKAAYSAWWEIIPAPSLTITNMKVGAGDHMSASIAEAVPDSNVWTITLKDLTRGESYSTTVPYSSTHATAEWIEETPLILGTNAGFAALPNLARAPFDLATTDGQPAKLSASEEMQLVDSNGKVIGAPSAPDTDADGFNACAWATACPAPSSS